MKIEMNPNEIVVRASDSEKVIPGSSVKGKLILTNQRLYFKCESKKNGHDTEILPKDIEDVMFFKNSFLFPKGLNIVTKNGVENKFLVKRREDWSEMIVKMC